MKKIVTIVLSCVLLLCSGYQADAQLLNSLVNAARRKAASEAANAPMNPYANQKKAAENTQASTANVAPEVEETNQVAASDVPQTSTTEAVQDEKVIDDKKIVITGERPAEVDLSSKVSDIEKYFEFYADYQKKAILADDIDYLCSMDGLRLHKLMTRVVKQHPNYQSDLLMLFLKYTPIEVAQMEVVSGISGLSQYIDMPMADQYFKDVEVLKQKIAGTDDKNKQDCLRAILLTETRNCFKTYNMVDYGKYEEMVPELTAMWDEMSPEYQDSYMELMRATTKEGIEAADKNLAALDRSALVASRKEYYKTHLQETPVARHNDPDLLKKCVPVIVRSFPEIKPVDSMITSVGGWIIERNVFGNIIDRIVYVSVIWMDEEIGQYAAREFSLKQEFLGNGQFESSPKLDGIGETKYVKY